MNTLSPRRSARLAQEQARSHSSHSTPSFAFSSQPSSVSTTSRPSPVDESLNPPPPPPTPQQANLRQQQQNNSNPHHFAMAQQSQFGAPLPSPSANETAPFFTRSHPQANAFQQSAQNASPFSQQSYSQIEGQPQHLHPHSNSMSQPHPRTINGMSPQMPPDFLAEAAKRAQIACLMRDMGDVSL